VAVAAAALRPIAAFREQQQARRAARQGATPTPELPAGTPTTPLPEVE